MFAQSAGNTGLSFLKLGFGARNVAMSDLGVVGVNDLTALNYNPAQLSTLTSPELSFTHNSLFTDVSSEMFAAGFSAFGLPFAIGINTTSIANIEVREKPGPALSTFDAHYFMGSLSSAYQIDENVSAGISLKYLYENLYTDDANGIGFDVGVTYKGLVEGLELGASLRNLGSLNKLRNEETKLPKDLRFGGAYSFHFDSVKTGLNIIAGYQKYLDINENHLHIGAEGVYNDFLFLRAGYATGYDSKGLSAGFGLKWNSLNIDYAYVPYKYGLGDSQIITLTYKF